MPCASSCERAGDDLVDRAVVPEMDHLAAARLQDAAHDVDRGVVAVEQARRRDEAHLVRRLVDERLAGDGDDRSSASPVTRRCRRRERKLTPRRRTRSRRYYDVYVNVNLNRGRIGRVANASCSYRGRGVALSRRRRVAYSQAARSVRRSPAGQLDASLPCFDRFARALRGRSSRPRCARAPRRGAAARRRRQGAVASRASPSTARQRPHACCCSPMRRSPRPPSTSPTWSARAWRTTARPAWRTCSST